MRSAAPFCRPRPRKLSVVSARIICGTARSRLTSAGGASPCSPSELNQAFQSVAFSKGGMWKVGRPWKPISVV